MRSPVPFCTVEKECTQLDNIVSTYNKQASLGDVGEVLEVLYFLEISGTVVLTQPRIISMHNINWLSLPAPRGC